MTISIKLAGWLCRSSLCASGCRLWERNRHDWNMKLSKWEKLRAGAYLILSDYEKGIFPPVFTDQSVTHAAEIARSSGVPGMDFAGIMDAELRKPFWADVKTVRRYLTEFVRLLECLDTRGIRPPARLLELGCGGGWTAEFLATVGYEVTATTIAPDEVVEARRRVESLKAKRINPKLQFVALPMESVANDVGPGSHYDAVYMYEALHHAFDWRKAMDSCHACLKPGGWLLLCHEPNLVHTFLSYRVAKIGNQHEIGFSRRELVCHLRQAGFSRIDYLTPYLHFWVKPHWICARKAT